MHLLVRETRTLDDAEAAEDLGQSPAELVFLSFSDSDLGAVASAWNAMPHRRSLRVASLARLRHPMSVDLYAEQVVAQARCVVVRLLGGLEYWRYGAEELAALCRRRGIALALLPGCERDEGRLQALSTVAPEAWARLDGFFRHGGPRNVAAALALAAHCAGRAEDDGAQPEALPVAGWHGEPEDGPKDGPARAAIVFYRSHLLAGDTAPVVALAEALRARGFVVRSVYVSSLKDAEAAAFVAGALRDWAPRVVLNMTAFSARRDGASPLDAAGAPVLQTVLAGSSEALWTEGFRGLSQTDLAMQVVLPELDGRLLTGAVSFKDGAAFDPALEFARSVNAPHAAGIALAADRAAGWARLAATPRAGRRVAVVLSDYPGAAAGGHGIGHAVGLDTFASLSAIAESLAEAGYGTGPAPADLAATLCDAPPAPVMTLDAYRAAFASLPDTLRAQVEAAWGPPEADPACIGGSFRLRHLRLGALIAAVQPDRILPGADRKALYHDADAPPCHAYIAFHIWLRDGERVHALVHLGAHGTLEWLPGKAAALSDTCWPRVLTGGLPVIYPFIVNNPGEAAAAKRRIGAVTLGHMTPPLAGSALHGEAQALERLIDEYAEADGLDRRRGALLRQDILARAESCGLLAESGADAAPDEPTRLARLDAYLCDVKDLQIRDGLHVFGRAPAETERLLAALLQAQPEAEAGLLRDRLLACGAAERDALLAALDGGFVQPGPAGAPTRGRADVLPTGRNLFAIDPRAIPTPAALRLAEAAAAAILQRHLQDQGDWLTSVVIDVWGSAAMRTGGEDLALAFVLMGVRPLWDAASGRVTGIEVVPTALLDRPRVDVTLRISGLFRDAFPGQLALFAQAVAAVATRDWEGALNPFAASLAGLDDEARQAASGRIYGAAPGRYGAGIESALLDGGWQDRDALGSAYLDTSAYRHDGADPVADRAGFARRVAGAQALLHQQDHAELDLLDSPDTAAHEGGFAAAAALLGAAPALYHTDTAIPETPRVRLTAEEIARVVRGRAANPDWIAGQMRHGRRGATEIARALDALHGFAATLPERFDTQFGLLFDATLGDAAVAQFLERENPAASSAMAARFDEAIRRGLWQPRRNSVAAVLATARAR